VQSVLTSRTAPPRLAIDTDPAKHGLSYEAVDVASADGVRLSAWVVVVAGSRGVVVVNHPLNCTRESSPTGLDGVAVDFVPMLKALAAAGFSFVTYDQRAQGESDGGVGKTQRGPKEVPCGTGATEWQDLVGVLRFVAAHPVLCSQKVCVLAQCMGANAAFHAAKLARADFAEVRCMVAVQPTISSNMMSRLTKIKAGADLSADVDDLAKATYGFGAVDTLDNVGAFPDIPLLVVQMRGDVYAEDAAGSDTQRIFDAVPTKKKQLLWLGAAEKHAFGSCKRFEAYNFFGAHPAALTDFLNASLAARK
jgi:pimeloyl-ACP methyl ester carboxylesterase